MFFKIVVDRNLVSGESPFPRSNTLAWAQHYGAPTRLIDVSSDWRVAAFFGADDKRKESLKNGWTVWAFKTEYSERLLGQLDGDWTAESALEALLEPTKSELDLFIETQNRNGYLVVNPPNPDDRREAQSGLFVAQANPWGDFSSAVDEARVWLANVLELSVLELLNRVEHAPAVRIDFPSSARREALDWLAKVGISNETLFPGEDDEVAKNAFLSAWNEHREGQT